MAAKSAGPLAALTDVQEAQLARVEAAFARWLIAVTRRELSPSEDAAVRPPVVLRGSRTARAVKAKEREGACNTTPRTSVKHPR